jgi:hypothetical protein
MRVIVSDVYELDVPSGIYNYFCVDLLCHYLSDPLPLSAIEDAQYPPRLDGDTPIWVVEQILQTIKWKNRRGILVKWVGY